MGMDRGECEGMIVSWMVDGGCEGRNEGMKEGRKEGKGGRNNGYDYD